MRFRGHRLPLTAMRVLVLTALVSRAADLSRVYHAPNRFQSARDAGVLAERRAELTNGYDTNAQATTQTYFKANFDQTQQGTRTSLFDTETDVNSANNTKIMR